MTNVGSRISSSNLHLGSLNNMASLRNEMDLLNYQISSQKLARRFDQLNGKVESISGFETKVSGIDTYLNNNEVVKLRLKTYDQKIGEVQDVLTEFKKIITLRISANGDKIGFRQQAEALLDKFASQLNANVEGRYIFSGSATNTKSIEKPYPGLAVPGIADDNYYEGNSDILSAKVSDDLEIEYGILASNPAFQQLYAAIQTAIEGDEDSNNGEISPLLHQANGLAEDAKESLAELRTGVLANMNNLTTISEQHQEVKLFFTEALTDTLYVKPEDLPDLTSKVAFQQSVLQATFMAFSRISQMKLTDYLK